MIYLFASEILSLDIFLVLAVICSTYHKFIHIYPIYRILIRAMNVLMLQLEKRNIWRKEWEKRGKKESKMKMKMKICFLLKLKK